MDQIDNKLFEIIKQSVQLIDHIEYYPGEESFFRVVFEDKHKEDIPGELPGIILGKLVEIALLQRKRP